MNDLIKVKKCLKEELENLFKIEEKIFFDESYSFVQFVEMFNNKNYLIYVAKLDNIIVGYIIVNYVYEEANIIKIATLQEYRNSGIATKLLKYTFLKLKKLGVDNIYLEVKSNNEIAKSFYNKNGFVCESIRKKYYKDIDALILWNRKF